MDLTKTDKFIYSNKIFNGETVGYGFFYSVSFVLFLILKQALKGIIVTNSAVPIVVAFVLSMLVMFLFEKKFVFDIKCGTKLPRQIVAFAFRLLVDIGFFKIFQFCFDTLLKMDEMIPYVFSAVMIFFFNFYFDRLIVFDTISTPQDTENKKVYKRFFDNRFVLLSMGVGALGLLFIYMLSQLFPFGDVSVLRMDLYHQYGPLFVEFYDRVVSHKTFLYSWQSGGGSSFLGNYFNYLSSPLSFIIFLFDRNQIGDAVTTIVLVKGSLAAGSFAYFLKKSFDSHSYSTAAFGVMYGFSGYFLAYYWNIMWLDGMILLPIVALGIEKIINDGKIYTYIISLCLLMFSSYYMGYMVCIFAVIYFLLYYFAYNEFGDKIHKDLSEKENPITKIFNLRFINSGVKFAFASLLCGALCAVFLIPLYYMLQASSATSDHFPSSFESYFNLIDMISSHLAGLETTIRSSGDDVLPNIYCGILTILLVPLFVINKKIRLREKAAYILALLFFVFCFDNNYADFIWHGLHFPNDLPFRYSFLYVFIILIVAFKALKNIECIGIRDIGIVGMIWILVILLYQKSPTNKISEATIYISLAFVILWTFVLFIIKKNHLSKLVIGVTVICLTFCEVIVSDVKSYSFTQPQSPYVENMETYQNAIDYLEEKDKGFYRTELTYLETRMDPCIYNYKGMSVFSSMAYNDYSQAQYSLGMAGNRVNSYTYNSQTPVYNMMYGIKYLIKEENSIEPSGNYFKKIYTTNDKKHSKVYKNKYSLPIAMVVADDIQNWNTNEGNPFEIQEDLIDRSAGVSNIFVPMEFVNTDSYSVNCDEVFDNGTFFFTDAEADAGGNIEITLKAANDSNVFIYVTSSDIENVNYYWNDGADTEYQNISEPYIKDLGAFKSGDEVKVTLDLSGVEAESGNFEIYAYTVDKDVLDAAHELLEQGGMKITKYSDTTLEGTINAGFDGYLYTSIPYDDGWDIYIDGKKASTFAIGGKERLETDSEEEAQEANSNMNQLATTISQGSHKVRFVYSPRGKKAGILVTAGGIIALVGYEIFKRIDRKNIFLLNVSKNK